MTFRTTAILVLLSVSLAGCDEGGGDPNNDFRDGTSCLKTGTTTSTMIVVKGMDPDWVLDPDTALKFAPEQADEFIIAITRMDPRTGDTCKKLCDDKDLDWSGGTCVGARDYSLGEFESYETEDGEPRWSVKVDTGKTESGCVCE